MAPSKSSSSKFALGIVVEARHCMISVPDIRHPQGTSGKSMGAMEGPRHTTPGTLQPPKVYCIAQQHLFQGMIAVVPQSKGNGLLRIRWTGNTIVFPAPLLNLTSAGSLACVRSIVSSCSRRNTTHCVVCSVAPLLDLAQRRLVSRR